MFRGRFPHNLDEKGRLSIPARFRDLLRGRYDGKLIITSVPTHLKAYPLEEWRGIEDEIGRIKMPPPEVVAFQRYFLAGGMECNLDSQNRILIPQNLREETGIDREVMLVGMLNHFEIWNKTQLQDEFAKTRENFDNYSRFISELSAGKDRKST
jgi:MraZ protein